MRRGKAAFAALGLIALSSVAFGADAIAGISPPPTISAEGRTLRLNGAGLRKKLVFKVYVAALYLETPSHSAEEAVSRDEVRQMRLWILRSLKGRQISEAISEGFERNSKATLPALQARLDRLNAMVPDVSDGDQLTLTAVPGRGTVVSVKGAEKGTIEGKDFADALFSVWLGTNPVQEDLKRALLGR